MRRTVALSSIAIWPCSPPARRAAFDRRRARSHQGAGRNARCHRSGQGRTDLWAFVGPEADPFNIAGVKIGKHYGGPTWEAAGGSKVFGAVKARADMAGTIPWLLLTTTPSGQTGLFSTGTSIQRVNTVGGTAPATTCAAANAGNQARIPCTADCYLLSRS